MGWFVNANFRPLYSRERDPIFIVHEAEWSEGQAGRVRKTSHTLEFDPRTVQPLPISYTAYAGLITATDTYRAAKKHYNS
jgi:hypothetical protein